MPAAADDEFAQIIQNGYAVNSATEYTDPTPYGPATTVQPHKAGLTTRGKAALAIGTTVIAGGSLLGYQAYSANAAQADLKAQELALKVDALELEKLRVLNQSEAVDKQTQTEQATARQTAVDTCVKSLKGQVGKGYGSPSYGEIVEDCQAQYPTTGTGDDMQSAASTRAAGDTTGSDGGGVNDGALLGILALGAVVVLGAKKGIKTAPAQ